MCVGDDFHIFIYAWLKGKIDGLCEKLHEYEETEFGSDSSER